MPDWFNVGKLRNVVQKFKKLKKKILRSSQWTQKGVVDTIQYPLMLT